MKNRFRARYKKMKDVSCALHSNESWMKGKHQLADCLQALRSCMTNIIALNYCLKWFIGSSFSSPAVRFLLWMSFSFLVLLGVAFGLYVTCDTTNRTARRRTTLTGIINILPRWDRQQISSRERLSHSPASQVGRLQWKLMIRGWFTTDAESFSVEESSTSEDQSDLIRSCPNEIHPIDNNFVARFI